MKIIIYLIAAYLIGTISGANIVGKLCNVDITKFGSKNPGTTNTFRVLGKKWGIVTFLIDFFKGFLLVYILKEFLNLDNFIILLGILFCVIGHDFPFQNKFKGGKGVATTLGALTLYDFKLALMCFLIWMFLKFCFHIVAIASIGFLISIPIFAYLMHYPIKYCLLFLVISLLGIIRHESNIKKLINERKGIKGD